MADALPLEGRLKPHCLPTLNSEPLTMTVSGSVTRREGPRILSIQIRAKRPVATNADAGSSGDNVLYAGVGAGADAALAAERSVELN